MTINFNYIFQFKNRAVIHLDWYSTLEEAFYQKCGSVDCTEVSDGEIYYLRSNPKPVAWLTFPKKYIESSIDK